MTTFDPDSGQQDLEVLRRVQREFDGRLGLNCYCRDARPYLRGDEVDLLPAA